MRSPTAGDEKGPGMDWSIGISRGFQRVLAGNRGFTFRKFREWAFAAMIAATRPRVVGRRLISP